MFKKCWGFNIFFFVGGHCFHFDLEDARTCKCSSTIISSFLIQKSMALREPCSSSFINRMVSRNVKCAGGLLHMLSLILISCTLLTHRSNSTETSTVMLAHVKEKSDFPCVKLSSSLAGKESHLKCFGGYIHLKCSAEPALKNWYFLVFFEALS